MRLTIKSSVSENYLRVFEHLERELFDFLKPKGADMEVMRFDGSRKGDEIHLKFNSPIKFTWISIVTEDYSDDQCAYFIDEGETLPPGLKYWRHKHFIRKVSPSSCVIEDQMEFKGKNILWSLFYSVAMYFSFLPRKKAYQKYFDLLGNQAV